MLDAARRFDNMIHNKDKYDTHLQMQRGKKATCHDQIGEMSKSLFDSGWEPGGTWPLRS